MVKNQETKTACTMNSWRLLAMGSQQARQCSKGDNCSFRHDVNKRGKLHHQICLRILSCSRVSENHREPEVPEADVPVVECFDGFESITSKELAPIHSVKNGILQNACSTSRRMDADLGKVLLCALPG